MFDLSHVFGRRGNVSTLSRKIIYMNIDWKVTTKKYNPNFTRLNMMKPDFILHEVFISKELSHERHGNENLGKSKPFTTSRRGT